MNFKYSFWAKDTHIIGFYVNVFISHRNVNSAASILVKSTYHENNNNVLILSINLSESEILISSFSCKIISK